MFIRAMSLVKNSCDNADEGGTSADGVQILK